ncbi:MAG: dihydropteroate synthase [Herpetosiphon sp.]
MYRLRLLEQPLPWQQPDEITKFGLDPVSVQGWVWPWRVIQGSGLSTASIMLLQSIAIEATVGCVRHASAETADAGDILLFGTERQLEEVADRLRVILDEGSQSLGASLALLLHSTKKPAGLQIRSHWLPWGKKTYVMGIVNVTPDSFSGDGLLGSTQGTAASLAAQQALEFASQGADMIDVGGESTRPGAPVVPTDEEQRRVVPVIRALRERLDTVLSVDTWKAPVAKAALDAGADLVNDIWGLRLPDGQWNEPLAWLVAERGAPIVIMHNRRAVATHDRRGGHYRSVAYNDLLGEIIAELSESVAFAQQVGIARERIIVDPGIGFGKTPEQNLVVLRHLSELRTLGLPVLLGTSRKSFIGSLLDQPAPQRVEGTGATIALGIQSGVDIIRVHDVLPAVRVSRVADAIVRGQAAVA